MSVYSNATPVLYVFAIVPMTSLGQSVTDDYGQALGVCGDIDGDGHPELIVSDPSWIEGMGSVFVYSPKRNVCLYRYSGPSGTGVQVAGNGDLDADGRPDLMFLSVYGKQSDRPCIEARSGSDGGVLFALDKTVVEKCVRRFGGNSTIEIIPDHNEDSHDDFIIGATLFSGADARVLLMLDGEGAARVGDLDGDDEADFACWTNGRDRASGTLALCSGANGHQFGDILRVNEVISGVVDLSTESQHRLVMGLKPLERWRFERLVSLSPASMSLSREWRSPVSVGVLLRLVSDINGDGVSDIMAVSNRGYSITNYVAFVSGMSGESLLVRRASKAGLCVLGAVQLSDLDSDGYPDFAYSEVGNPLSPTVPGQVVICSGKTGETLFSVKKTDMQIPK